MRILDPTFGILVLYVDAYVNTNALCIKRKKKKKRKDKEAFDASNNVKMEPQY